MQRSHLRVYVHYIWATWDRLPTIPPDLRHRLYAVIRADLEKHGCAIEAINGMPDHVHVLTAMPATVTIAQLAHAAKGASSRWLNGARETESSFRWQGRYGAHSVSPHDRARVAAYIRNQEQHHRDGTTWPDAESTDDLE